MREEADRSEEAEELARGMASVIASQVAGEQRPSAWSSASFAELERRIAGRARGRWLRILSVATAAGALAGMGLFWARAHLTGGSRAVITFTVDGRPPTPSGAVPEPGATSTSVLSFSDGTRIEMAPRARGRVVELGPRGGRIALEEGKAHVEVAHRPGAAWLFQAGPFAITVHGTAFSVAWSSADAHFDLRMESGVVSVEGPVSGGEIVLRAGETLSIGLGDRGAPASARTAAAAPISAAGRPAGTAPLDPEPGRRSAHARASEPWPAALADGRGAAVVADARRLGIASVLATRSSEDLAALADAARFQRDDGLARQALLAQRRRFAGTMRSAEASFLLGRLEDESSGGPTRALAWYDRYLAEAPRGAYVSEALGRKMMVLERAHRRAEAAGIATAYLQRFPRGTYAAAAEALVSAP